MQIKKIHHVAVAVPDLESSISFWRDTFGLSLDHVEDVASQKSKVAAFSVGQTKIELVQPTGDDSGVARFIAERGGGMHHICFEVENIDAALNELKAKGVRLINETPQILEGRKMAFIHPRASQGVLVELYELI